METRLSSYSKIGELKEERSTTAENSDHADQESDTRYMDKLMTFEEYYKVVRKMRDKNRMVEEIVDTIGRKDVVRKRVRFTNEVTNRLFHEY